MCLLKIQLSLYQTSCLMTDWLLALQLQVITFGAINGQTAGRSFTSWLDNAVALVPLTIMLWLRTSEPSSPPFSPETPLMQPGNYPSAMQRAAVM